MKPPSLWVDVSILESGMARVVFALVPHGARVSEPPSLPADVEVVDAAGIRWSAVELEVDKYALTKSASFVSTAHLFDVALFRGHLERGLGFGLLHLLLRAVRLDELPKPCAVPCSESAPCAPCAVAYDAQTMAEDARE